MPTPADKSEAKIKLPSALQKRLNALPGLDNMSETERLKAIFSFWEQEIAVLNSDPDSHLPELKIAEKIAQRLEQLGLRHQSYLTIELPRISFQLSQYDPELRVICNNAKLKWRSRMWQVEKHQLAIFLTDTLPELERRLREMDKEFSAEAEQAEALATTIKRCREAGYVLKCVMEPLPSGKEAPAPGTKIKIGLKSVTVVGLALHSPPKKSCIYYWPTEEDASGAFIPKPPEQLTLWEQIIDSNSPLLHIPTYEELKDKIDDYIAQREPAKRGSKAVQYWRKRFRSDKAFRTAIYHLGKQTHKDFSQLILDNFTPFQQHCEAVALSTLDSKQQKIIVGRILGGEKDLQQAVSGYEDLFRQSAATHSAQDDALKNYYYFPSELKAIK